MTRACLKLQQGAVSCPPWDDFSFSGFSVVPASVGDLPSRSRLVYQEYCGNDHRRQESNEKQFARRIMYMRQNFCFFPLLSPKYCKYTITTIINSNDFTSFSPIPDAQIPRNKSSDDKTNTDEADRGNRVQEI